MPGASADDLRELFDACPQAEPNPVGALARSVLVSKMKGATPGAHTQPLGYGSGPPYRDIFFPGYQPVPYEADVARVTGLDDGWWSSLSVAGLADVVYAVSSRERSHVEKGKVDADLGAFNQQLQSRAAAWYAFTLGNGYPPVAGPLRALSGDRPAALREYTGRLTAKEWIKLKIAQFHSGNWPDRDWELYHHWLKLTLLGASDAEVDRVITADEHDGLPVPPSVTAGAWRSYRQWFSPAALGQGDIQPAATPGMLKCDCKDRRLCCPEENAMEFMANGQPGSRYWHGKPPPSCLPPGTGILRPDGSLTAIENLRPGDLISTPSGEQPVLLVSRVPRAGRPLFRLDGTGLRATGGHPWVLAERAAPAAARYAAAQPDLAREQVPVFGQDGVAGIGGGTALLAWHDGQPAVLRVSGVTEERGTGAGEWVHGLLTGPDADGFAEYVVSDGSATVVTAPELPRFYRVPEAALALLHTIPPAAAACQQTLAALPDDEVQDHLYRALRMLSGTIIAQAWSAAARARPAKPPAAGLRALVDEALAGLLPVLQPPGQDYDWRSGCLADALTSVLGEEVRSVMDTGWRHPPVPGGTAADVVLTALDLHWDRVAPAPSITVRLAGPSGAELACPAPPAGGAPAGAAFRHVLRATHRVQPDRLGLTGQARVLRITATLRAAEDHDTTAGHGADGAAETAYVLWPPRCGYQRIVLPVPIPHRAGYGRLAMDVRSLPPGRADPADPDAGWTGDEGTRFALAFGHALGRALASVLPDAISRSRQHTGR